MPPVFAGRRVRELFRQIAPVATVQMAFPENGQAESHFAFLHLRSDDVSDKMSPVSQSLLAG
jgi:hypothetical protein